jgi:hypothetical protein
MIEEDIDVAEMVSDAVVSTELALIDFLCNFIDR